MAGHRQFIKYVIVGLISNGILYLAYLFITSSWMGHKSAMSSLYGIGVLQTFIFNRAWTFRHQGRISRLLPRYIAAYAFGYFFNLAALLLLVDYWGFPHQIVQGCLIFVIAVLIFLLQKFWVFSHDRIYEHPVSIVNK